MYDDKIMRFCRLFFVCIYACTLSFIHGMDDPDNDGISTEDEISFGMDPYDPNDISIGVGEYNLGLTYRDARVSIRGNVEAIRITGTTLETNYALGSKVSTSSVESKGLGGAYVSDGSIGDGVTEGSRWSSAFADDQFIQLELPKAAVLNQVVIHWEAVGRGGPG